MIMMMYVHADTKEGVDIGCVLLPLPFILFIYILRYQFFLHISDRIQSLFWPQ